MDGGAGPAAFSFLCSIIPRISYIICKLYKSKNQQCSGSKFYFKASSEKSIHFLASMNGWVGEHAGLVGETPHIWVGLSVCESSTIMQGAQSRSSVFGESATMTIAMKSTPLGRAAAWPSVRKAWTMCASSASKRPSNTSFGTPGSRAQGGASGQRALTTASHFLWHPASNNMSSLNEPFIAIALVCVALRLKILSLIYNRQQLRSNGCKDHNWNTNTRRADLSHYQSTFTISSCAAPRHHTLEKSLAQASGVCVTGVYFKRTGPSYLGLLHPCIFKWIWKVIGKTRW